MFDFDGLATQLERQEAAASAIGPLLPIMPLLSCAQHGFHSMPSATAEGADAGLQASAQAPLEQVHLLKSANP